MIRQQLQHLIRSDNPEQQKQKSKAVVKYTLLRLRTSKTQRLLNQLEETNHSTKGDGLGGEVLASMTPQTHIKIPGMVVCAYYPSVRMWGREDPGGSPW